MQLSMRVRHTGDSHDTVPILYARDCWFVAQATCVVGAQGLSRSIDALSGRNTHQLPLRLTSDFAVRLVQPSGVTLMLAFA
jgi:hypothetical protein